MVATFPTVEQVQTFCRDETPTASFGFYSDALDAAIMELNNGCARQFVVAGTPSARVYTPDSYSTVTIHDCTSVTSVVNDGATITPTAWQLEPLNGLSWAGESIPYTRIRLIDSTTFDFGLYNGKEATVTVTAAWGWPTIPSQIVSACYTIAKDIAANRDVRFGLVAVTEAAGISARTNPTVRTAIETYRRVEAIGIA
jgi:hypothetical protein